MDTQLFVAVNVLAVSAMIAVALLARRDWNFAWSIAVQLIILAAGGLALYVEWPHAGTLAGGLFVLLVLLPGVLLIASRRMAARGDLAASVRYAAWAAAVHPTPVLRLSARMTAAQAISDPVESAAAFHAIAASIPPYNRAVVDMAAERALDRWPAVLDVIAADASGARHHVMNIRALGETGQFEDMISAYTAVRTRLPADERAIAELFVLAFAGRVSAVTARVDGPHNAFDAETRRYWKAVAALNSGDPDSEGMARLASSGLRGATRLAAARHLAAGPRAAASRLSRTAAASVDTLEARTVRDTAHAAAMRTRAVATLLLMTANACMFGAELMMGGADDLETLYTLGGLWPAAVVQAGEWWRVASALFLHFGWTHLLVNLGSLYVLGRIVEARFGIARMLLIYLLGGVGSSASVLALMHNGWINDGLLVGASGAVMALFGAMLAFQLVSWRKSRDALDRGPVLALVSLILFQTAIDFTVPHVSIAAHLSGVICGFVIASTLLLLWPRLQRLRL